MKPHGNPKNLPMMTTPGLGGVPQNPLRPVPEGSNTGFEVVARTLQGQHYPVHVTGSDTLLDLKQQILAVEGTPVEAQRIVHSGQAKPWHSGWFS